MASKAIGFLNFKFAADLTSFERAMNKAQKKLKKFGKSVTKAGQNLSRNLTLPIVGLGIASIKAFDQQQKAIAQVEAGLKSTGNQVGFTSKKLQEMAADLQKTSLFGDEEILQGATAQLLTFTNITGEEFARTQQVVLDLATRLDGDLKSSSIMLGKALNDPVANLSALSRAGIQFSTDQKSTIKSLVETNRLADAQTIILAELEKQYGGSAEAASKAGMGPVKQLMNQLSDLSEQIGARLIPHVRAFSKWIVGLAEEFDGLSESTKDNIVKWGLILAAIGPVLIIIGKVSIGLGSLVGALKSVGGFLAAGPWLAAAAGIAAVGYAIYDAFIATNKLTTAQDDLNSITKTAQASIMDEKVAVDLLTKELTAQGLSLEDKRIALQQLKTISPEYYGSLEIAKGKVEGLDQATKNYTASILQQAKAEAMKQKLVELNIELLDAEEKMQKQLATTGGFLGADLKGSDIEKSSLEALKEQKQLMQDRIDALSKEYNITKKISDLTTGTEGTGGTTPTGGTGGTGGLGKKVEQMEALSLATNDTFEEISLLSHRLDGLEMPEGLFNTDPLEEYRGDLGDLGEQMANFFGKDIEEIEQISYDATMSIAKNLSQGADSWKEYGQNVKNVIRDTIGALISEAVMTAALSALKTVPFPFNLIAAGIAAGAARTAFNSMIPEFAEGGLVTGPTTALIGEGVGTSMANPEVVAPLDKLKQYMGGGNQNIIVEGVLKGNDIYLSNRNTSINRLRTT